MDAPEIEEVVEAVMHKVLDQRRSVSSDEHADHHAYLRTLIEREEARRDMYRKLTVNLLQWSITGLLGIISAKIFTGHWPFSN